MRNIDKVPNLSGLLTIKQAREILGVTDKRIYHYIADKRLSASKLGNNYILSEEEVRRFKPKPIGRVRTKPTLWHEYKSGSDVLGTYIEVGVREGQEVAVIEKLLAMRDKQEHTFMGTMARYILQDEDEEANILQILLIGKDTELPDEETQQAQLEAFKADFADVLDWSTAKYSKKIAVVHT